MTYQQEKKQRDANKAKRARKYIFVPVLLDRMGGSLLPAPGTRVVKVQPYGCPANGTMGQCFIGDAITGEFLGLVCLNSLTPAPVAKSHYFLAELFPASDALTP